LSSFDFGDDPKWDNFINFEKYCPELMNFDQFQVLTSEEATIAESSQQVDTSLTDST